MLQNDNIDSDTLSNLMSLQCITNEEKTVLLEVIKLYDDPENTLKTVVRHLQHQEVIIKKILEGSSQSLAEYCKKYKTFEINDKFLNSEKQLSQARKSSKIANKAFFLMDRMASWGKRALGSDRVVSLEGCHSFRRKA